MPEITPQVRGQPNVVRRAAGESLLQSHRHATAPGSARRNVSFLARQHEAMGEMPVKLRKINARAAAKL
jgi:hypothetical protein